MEIKINFICHISEIFDDYIKYIKEEHKSIYFGNNCNKLDDNVYCSLDCDIINKLTTDLESTKDEKSYNENLLEKAL